MTVLEPLDLEILIFFFPFPILLPEETSGTCHALVVLGKVAADLFVMRMADAPRSALVAEIVLVIGLFEPKDVSIRGEAFSPFSPSPGFVVAAAKMGIFDVDGDALDSSVVGFAGGDGVGNLGAGILEANDDDLGNDAGDGDEDEERTAGAAAGAASSTEASTISLRAVLAEDAFKWRGTTEGGAIPLLDDDLLLLLLLLLT
jgi:hypothetical protein